MQKNLPFIFLILSCTVFSSCQKEVSSAIQNAASNKVKTYTEDITDPASGHSVTTYTLAYDGNNRVISLTSATAAGGKFVFTYPSGNKYSLEIFNANLLTIHEDAFINSNSLVDSTFQYNDTQDTSTEKYFYNAGNQLMMVKEYIYSTLTGSELSNTTSYTYNAVGDQVLSADTNGNEDSFEYYTDLTYAEPVISGLPDANTGKKIHLVKKHSVTSNSAFIGSADYTYTFDTSNRISAEKQTVSDGSIFIKSYTYF